MNHLALGGTGAEDGGDFLSGKSNLNSLFGLNAQMMNTGNSNQSLTYKAPKPPGKQNEKLPQQAAASGVALAVAVTAFRLVKNQYSKQGRLGAAILRNPSANDYKILMYVTKQKPVSTLQITPAFAFTVQANNYASFTDDQQQTWSILFDNGQQQVDFAKQICLAKYMSGGQSPSEFIAQDLTPRDGSAAIEVGDSLEVKYTGWLLNTDGTLGVVFDSNHSTEKTFRFKTGKGKVIKGWESGMLGMQKSGKRFIVIPPQLAYGSKQVGNKVPPNSTLVFEVDLLRMKQSKDTSSVKSGGSADSVPLAAATEQLPTIQTQVPGGFPVIPGNGELPTMEKQQDLSAPGPPTEQFYRSVLGFKRTKTPSFPYAAQWLEMSDGTKMHIVEPAENSLRHETVRGRTASLTDHMAQAASDTGRNDLVSRMAKMGHAMIPVTGAEQSSQHPNPTSAQYSEMMAPSPVHMQPQPPHHNTPNMMTSSAMHPQPANSPLHQAPSPHLQMYPTVGSYASHLPSTPTYQHNPMNPQVSSTSYQHMQNVPQQIQHGLQTQYLDTQQGIQQPNLQSNLDSPHHQLHQTQYGQYPNYRQPQQYNPAPGSDYFPILITEARQQSSELRSLQEKVDKVSGLVEDVKKNTTLETQQPQLGSSQAVDPKQIMHSVQRILQENDRLKEQVLEKNKQIETQNDKISELLQQNQKHVEKSNLILEQRNDTFKDSFEQSQARSLQLEQDKVKLTEKLSDSTSRVSELTLELSNAKQREGELKQKFKDIYMQEKERANEAEDKVKDLEESLLSAKQNDESRGKNEDQLASRIQEMREKMQEVVAEKNTNIEELADKLKKREAENAEMRIKMETAVRQLQAKIDDMGNTSDAAASNTVLLEKKISEMKEEISLLKTENAEFSESQEVLEGKLEISVQRFGQLRSVYEEQREKLSEANEELEEANLYKERYERLRTQATTMKERYDEKINELQSEIEDRGKETAPSPATSASSTNHEQLIAEVKKIMNVIFQRVKASISADEEYEGSEVLNLMLQIIKKTTLELMKSQTEKQPPEEVESEEDPSKGEDVPEVTSIPEDEKEPPVDQTLHTTSKSEPNEVQPESESQNTNFSNNMEEIAVTNKAEPDSLNEASQVEPLAPKVSDHVEPHVNKEIIENQEENKSEKENEESIPPEEEEVVVPDDVNEVEEVNESDAVEIVKTDKIIEESQENAMPEVVPNAAIPVVEENPTSEERIDDDVITQENNGIAATTEDKTEAKEDQPISCENGEEHATKDPLTSEDDHQEVESRETKSADTSPVKEKPVTELPDAEVKKEENQPSMNQMIADTIFNQIRVGREQDDDAHSLSRSSSVVEDRQPPPLFDDDEEDDDDLDWLK